MSKRSPLEIARRVSAICWCTVQKKMNVKTRVKETVGDTESGIGRASIAAE